MENISYKKVASKSNQNFLDLFVLINDNGEQKYISVKDLAVEDGKSMVNIDNHAKLKKANESKRLFTKKANGAKDKQVVLVDANVYEQVKTTTKVQKGFGYFVSTTIQGDKYVPAGYQRIVRVKESKPNKIIKSSDALNEKEYLLATLEDGTKKYLSRDEIVGSSTKKALGTDKLGKFVEANMKEVDGNKILEVEDINGDKLQEIDLTKAYIFENVTRNNGKFLFREKIEGNVHTTLSVDESGAPKAEENIIDKLHTEQQYMMEEDKPIIRVTNYEASSNNNGEYVKVTFAGESVDTMIKKSELFLNSELTNPVTEFSENLIGKTLYAKSEDENTHFKITRPIEVVQANFTYSKKKYLQETEKKEDIAADNTYIKLENGHYVKEKEAIKPIRYDYTKDGETPEAYLAKVVDSKKGEISIIIPASAFKRNGKKDSFKYGGYNITRKNVFGLKKSGKSVNDCDVIQTTTEQDKYQSCQVLRIAGNFDATTHERKKTNVENIEEIIRQAGEEFWRDYKEGKYIINQVQDEKGKYVVIIRDKRFVFNDHIDLPDYSNGYSEYAFNKPDGRYDLKKGMAKGFKSWALKALKYGFFAYAVGWPLLAVSATVAGIFLGTIAVSALMVPIRQLAKARAHNKKNRVPKDKTKCISQLNKKDILKELKDEYQKAINKKKEMTKDDQLIFIEKMERLEKRASQLAGGKTMSDFKVKNGTKTKVDASNYQEFKKYEAEMFKEEQELKKLFNDMKKGKVTREVYNAKYNEHQKNLYNYVSKGVFVPKDEKYQAVIDAIKTTKGFVIAKYGPIDENSTEKEKNTKEYLKKKSLKISKDFTCSISKTKKDEKENLMHNLKVVADENQVDYHKVIIQSNYAVETAEEQHVEQPVAEVQEDLTAQEEKKAEDKVSQEEKLITGIDSLGFDILEYKKTKRQSKTNPGAYEEVVRKRIVKENLTNESVRRIQQAIKFLNNENLGEEDFEMVEKYIKANLNAFLKTDGLTEKQISKLKGLQDKRNALVAQHKQESSKKRDEGRTT